MWHHDLGNLVSSIWEERLQPNNSREIFDLCSIARGYQADCQFLLPFFQHRIEDKVITYLNETNVPRNRTVLIGALLKCQNEIYGGDLHSGNYYDQRAEEELEYPYDPDFDSERYYEHEDRLQIDDDYREMWSGNMQSREERGISYRTSTQASWEDLFQKAVELVVQGPRPDFRFDLVDLNWHS